MSNALDTFARRRPLTVRRLLTGAHLYVLPLPALTVIAAVTGHTMATVVGILAMIGLYSAGYATATHRSRDQVAQARRDPLTGLPNRAPADEMLAHATRTRTPVTVALIDADGLHMINSNHGMAAGDQYLITVARRLETAVPAGGVLVRQGGDEFTIVAPGTDPHQLATNIGAALAGRAVIAGYRIQPRASVGIAATDPGDRPDDANHARARADAALYTAKRDGGQQIRVFDPARDPEPGPDGTRPLLRRRDVNPLSGSGVVWVPAPGEDLIPLLLSVADTHTLYEGLTAARDMCAHPGPAAHDGRPDTQPRTDAPHIDATPGDSAGVAASATARSARYARLIEHLTPIVDAIPAGADPATVTGEMPKVASAVLVGIAAQFTPLDLEALIITAAEAVHGQREDLSSRQLDLAARAYALLRDDDTD